MFTGPTEAPFHYPHTFGSDSRCPKTRKKGRSAVDALLNILERLAKAVEEGNQLKRIELRSNGTLPNDKNPRR
jgi:hypothetical protein